MRKSLFLLLVTCIFAVTAAAQKLPKPTQLPETLNPIQQSQLNAGTKLHDQKKYDEAIAIYDKLLAEAPDATTVLYEKSLTLYAKRDLTKAMETAYLGAKYKSEDLGLFYGIIGDCIDDIGKPDEAIKIYREAEAILKGDPEYVRHLAVVYYNVGLTYVRQKKYNDARVDLKKAVQTNPAYASPHYLLAMVYNGTKYKIPAFLAAARLLTLEINTGRSQAAAAIIRDTLKPAPKDPKTGSYVVNLDFFAPKDEGDFMMYDMILGTLVTVRTDKDKNKTENEIFVDSLGSVLSMIDEDKKLKDTFVGKQYLPFISEMKKKGFSEVFGYTVLYISGEQSAMKWLDAHNEKFGEFIAWTKAYQAPK